MIVLVSVPLFWAYFLLLLLFNTTMTKTDTEISLYQKKTNKVYTRGCSLW